MKAVLLKCMLVILAALFLGACGIGNDDECQSHDSRICSDSTLYWRDSCDNREEEIKYCPCGCNSDNSDCQDC